MKMVDSERRSAHVESLEDILDASTTDGVTPEESVDERFNLKGCLE